MKSTSVFKPLIIPILTLSVLVSCGGMLGDMANTIAQGQQQTLLMLSTLFKPLPLLALFNDGNKLTAGELVDLGLTLQNTPKTVNLTARNSGATDITIRSIIPTGTYADRFTVSNVILPVTLAPGQEIQFSVGFVSEYAYDGYKSSVIAIDTGPDYAPYNITVACERVEIPRANFELWRGYTYVPAGGSSDYGTVYASTLVIFTVKNTGTTTMVINAYSIDDPVNFSLPGPMPGPSIPAGGEASLRVYFNPPVKGTYSTALTVNYNDAVNPSCAYTVTLSGTSEEVPTREIDLLDGGVSRPTPYSPSPGFGSCLVNTTSPGKTLQITNLGTGDLTISSIVLSDTTNFTYVGPASATIPGNGQTTITVYYNPKSGTEGVLQTATLSITSNDADEETYTVTFEGTPYYNYRLYYFGNFNDGGTAPTDANLYVKNDTATLDDNATANLTKAGYSFGGWCTVSSFPGCSGTTYPGGGTYTFANANVNLYVRWNPVNLSVLYDANGGSGTPPVDSNTYTQPSNTAVTVLGRGSLSRDNYSFGGWCDDAGCSGITYSEGQSFTIGTTNKTLYARWIGQPNIVVANSCGSFPHHFGSMGADGDYNAPSGKQATGYCTFTVTNNGAGKLTVYAITKDGTNPEDFDVDLSGDFSSLPGVPVEIAIGGSKTFRARFDPLTIGDNKSANITVISSDPDSASRQLAVQGNGKEALITFSMALNRIYCEVASDDSGSSNLELWWDIIARPGGTTTFSTVANRPYEPWYTFNQGDTVYCSQFGGCVTREFTIPKLSAAGIDWWMHMGEWDSEDDDCLVCHNGVNGAYQTMNIHYDPTNNRMVFPYSNNNNYAVPNYVDLNVPTEIWFLGWCDREGQVRIYFNFYARDVTSY